MFFKKKTLVWGWWELFEPYNEAAKDVEDEVEEATGAVGNAKASTYDADIMFRFHSQLCVKVHG